MRKIIIFPGQGYQNIQMLTDEVQNFCYQNGLGDLVDAVLKDKNKIFDTQYAQALIIATQLVQSNKYKSTQNADTEYVYCGFSLGEISALIASGAINIEEGLKFARERGNICKSFSENELQAGVFQNEPKRTFSVAKIAYYDGLEADIEKFNLIRPEYEKISITNYIPTNDVSSQMYVTITGESNTLRNNLELFKGSLTQKTATMQCPFHSRALNGLIPVQINSFDSYISEVDKTCLSHVICTRTASMYNPEDSKDDINSSLAQYLVQPMQTEKTLLHIKEHYPEAEIIVTMGQAFAKGFAKQYKAIGGKQENVVFIEEATKASTDPSKALGEIVK